MQKKSKIRRSLVLSMLALWPLAGALGPAQAQGSPDLTLKVLTLNVWHGLRSGENKKRFPGEDAERRARRFEWQIEEIKRLGPDVLLFQEVNPNQRESRRYAKALGYDEIHKVTNCGLHLGFLYKIPRNVNEGLAILARPELDLRRVGKKRLSGNAICTASFGFQTKESRYGLFGEIVVDGRRVLVSTTHLSSPPFVQKDFEERLEDLVRAGDLQEQQRNEIVGELERKRRRNLAETELLLAEIDRYRRRRASAGKLPVLLGGDFNTEPATPGVLAVQENGFRTAGTGSEFLSWDPVTNQVNYDIGTKRVDPLPTFGIKQIQDLLAIRRTTARQIDYLFVSEDLEPLSAEMVLNRNKDGIYPSDHFGILATVRLP